jgi:uncharacterized membrane protein YdjX (TVP38/TMEM64 family)
MKPLLKIMLCLVVFFITVFILARVTGFLSLDQIEAWFIQLQNLPPLYLGGVIILLLMIDLFITVPTLGVTILAGYFLGIFYGALFSVIGMVLSGSVGYFLSRIYGKKVVNLILKKPKERREMIESFKEYGFRVIIFSRAVPMLPEISACLAGYIKMPFTRFITAWLISAVPYSLIASASGTVSTLENPMPAIICVIVINSVMWFGWLHFRNKKRADQRAKFK